MEKKLSKFERRFIGILAVILTLSIAPIAAFAGAGDATEKDNAVTTEQQQNVLENEESTLLQNEGAEVPLAALTPSLESKSIPEGDIADEGEAVVEGELKTEANQETIPETSTKSSLSEVQANQDVSLTVSLASNVTLTVKDTAGSEVKKKSGKYTLNTGKDYVLTASIPSSYGMSINPFSLNGTSLGSPERSKESYLVVSFKHCAASTIKGSDLQSGTNSLSITTSSLVPLETTTLSNVKLKGIDTSNTRNVDAMTSYLLDKLLVDNQITQDGTYSIEYRSREKQNWYTPALWDSLSNQSTSDSRHKFGTQAKEIIRITRSSDDLYGEATGSEITLNLINTTIDSPATLELNTGVVVDTDEQASLQEQLLTKLIKSVKIGDTPVTNYTAAELGLPSSLDKGIQSFDVTYRTAINFDKDPVSYTSNTVTAQVEIKSTNPTLTFSGSNATFVVLDENDEEVTQVGGKVALYPTKEYKVIITPTNGYGIQSISIKEAQQTAATTLQASSYDKNTHAATVTIAKDTLTKEGNYTFSAVAAQPVLTLNAGTPNIGVKNANLSTYEKLIEKAIIDGVINNESSVPALPTSGTYADYEVQYYVGKLIVEFWSPINPSSITGTIASLFHAFGSQDQEKVKVIFKGNDQYPGCTSDAITINITESRLASELTLTDKDVTIYMSDPSLPSVNEQLLAMVESLTDAEGDDIPYTIDSFTFPELTKVGSQEITIKYNGTDVDLSKNPTGYLETTANKTINVVSADASVITIYDGDHASVKINDTALDNEGSILLDPSKSHTVTITPDSDYTATKVMLQDTKNSEAPAITLDVTWQEKSGRRVGTTTLTTGMLEKYGFYDLTVTIEECIIAYKDGATSAPVIGVDPTNEDSRYKYEVEQRLFNALVDSENSIPEVTLADLESGKVKVEYFILSMSPEEIEDYEWVLKLLGINLWQSVDYVPTIEIPQIVLNYLPGIALHKFACGDTATEYVRFIRTADGDEGQFNEIASEPLQITLTDPRPTTQVDVYRLAVTRWTEDVDEMEADLFQKLVVAIYVENTPGQGDYTPSLDYRTPEYFEYEYDRSVGYKDITVKFKGVPWSPEFDGLAGSQFTTKVLIMPAFASIEVASAEKVYDGKVVKPEITVSTDKVKPLYAIIGFDLQGNPFVSFNFESITLLDLMPDSVKNILTPSIKELLETPLQDLLIEGATTIDQLNKNIEALIDRLSQIQIIRDFLEKEGVDVDQVFDGIKALMQAISETGIGDVTIGQAPSNAGVYTVFAVALGFNYYPALDSATITISPKTADVTISFDQQVEKELSMVKVQQMLAEETYAAMFNVSAYEGTTPITDAHPTVAFTGVTAEGKAYVSSAAPTEAGAYTQTAVFYGNYIAKPIARSFHIVKETAKIEFTNAIKSIDALSVKNMTDDERAAYFGIKMTPVEAASEVKISYTGLTYEGKAYNSAVAPTVAGVYTQTVSIDSNVYKAEPLVRMFTIYRIDTSIKMQNSVTATYDGETHGMSPKVYVNGEEDTELTDLIVTTYTGATSSTEAPVNAGAYLVTAKFNGTDVYQPSIAFGEVYIKKHSACTTITLGNLTTDIEHLIATGNDHRNWPVKTVSIFGDMLDKDLQAIYATLKCECGDGLHAGSFTVSMDIPADVKNNYAYVKVENGVHYVLDYFDISFDTAGGAPVPEPAQLHILEGTKIAKPAVNPEKTGYEFYCWKSSVTGKEFNFNVAPTSDDTIVASWSTIYYQIKYDGIRGAMFETLIPTAYCIEDEVTLVNPTKNGYEFTGWTGTDLEEPTMTVTIPQGSMGERTYTANWKKIEVQPEQSNPSGGFFAGFIASWNNNVIVKFIGGLFRGR